MAYADSTTIRGDYSKLISAYDYARKKQDYAKLLQKFGDGFKILNFLHLADQVIDIGSETIYITEEGVPERLVTVSIPESLSAPISPIITFATSDNSDDYFREGFDLYIPAGYTNKDIPVAGRVYLDGSDYKWKPYDSTVTITTAVVTKEFSLGASSWGYGTGQPDAMASGYYQRTTGARIMKETGGVEGGMIWQQNTEAVEMADGSKGLLSKLLTEMDFRLDSQIDSALFLSNKNANAALTAVSNISGGTHAIPSFDGLVPTMVEYAQPLTYSTNFDMTKFEAVKALLEAVGVTNREVDFMMGTGLMSNVENAMLSWTNTNSPGTELYDMISKYVGFNVKVVEKNSCKFNLIQLDSLSNPNKWGASEYPYKDWGFMFPKGTRNVTITPSGQAQQTLKLPHLTLGYAVGKTENRRRVFNVSSGVNGLGYANASNEYDGVKFYSLTHIVPIWAYMDQTILITKA